MLHLKQLQVLLIQTNYFVFTGPATCRKYINVVSLPLVVLYTLTSANQCTFAHTLLKIFKRRPDYIPCPIDKPCISLFNKVETQFLLIYLHRESKYWIKKVLTKQSLLKFMAQILSFLNFLENGDFFCNCRIFGIFK